MSLELLRRARVPGTDFLARRPAMMRFAAAARNYAACFSYQYLFHSGDTSTTRQSVPGFGAFHRAEFFLLVCGILLGIRRRDKPLLFIAFWLIVFPIGPCFLNQTAPNSNRIITALPAFQILFAYTLVALWRMFMAKREQGRGAQPARWVFQAALAAVCVMLVVNTASYFHAYFTAYPRESAIAWQYGWRDAIAFAEENVDEYPNVVVSAGLNYSYIEVLFYTRYAPARLLAEKTLTAPRMDENIGLFIPRIGDAGRYHIRPLPFRAKSNAPVLYILAPYEMTELETIKYISFEASKPATYLRLAVQR